MRTRLRATCAHVHSRVEAHTRRTVSGPNIVHCLSQKTLKGFIYRQINFKHQVFEIWRLRLEPDAKMPTNAQIQMLGKKLRCSRKIPTRYSCRMKIVKKRPRAVSTSSQYYQKCTLMLWILGYPEVRNCKVRISSGVVQPRYNKQSLHIHHDCAFKRCLHSNDIYMPQICYRIQRCVRMRQCCRTGF